jgi:DNA-binding beta-propeller fold protein YncE
MRTISRTRLVIALAVLGAAGGGRWLSGTVQGAGIVDFVATDDVGPWFKCQGSGCVQAGTKSLAVVQPGTDVRITVGGETNTVHTFTSLVYPEGAQHMPFDQPSAFRAGSRTVTLDDPGLYVFVCKVHPFMLAATVVDDPATAGLDMGENISLVNGITVPTSSDLATRLLRAFWLITNPMNYQDHDPRTNPALTWKIHYPAGVPVRITGGAVVDLKDTLEARYGNDVPIEGPSKPIVKGVGEVWVDTQYEMTESKTKPGTATALDASSWKVTKKVSLPEINMNNPHNMWTDIRQRLIYQTQWFDTKLTVFDRQTGKLVRNIEVGESPAHVMTRVDTDQVHVSVNGEGEVVELSPGARTIDRRIATQYAGDNPAAPHAHWMSHDGHTMVTPNSNTNDSTRIDLIPGVIAAKTPVGFLPIATGMMPDASKYYVSNYVDSSITCISIGAPRCREGSINLHTKTIGLLLGGTTLGNYDPITGTGFSTSAALPIQTPVSPNGKYMVTAATLTGTIAIIDTTTDTLAKVLPCSAGCHGVNFGAKKGGGYYAYVSSKFSNDLIVVDPDPDDDGNAKDARIAGRIVLTAPSRQKPSDDDGDDKDDREDDRDGNRRAGKSDSYHDGDEVQADDRVSAYAGTGGQGVLAIPLVYNGWVQKLPNAWKRQLTDKQLNPAR